MSRPIVRSVSALALELRERGLALRVQLCPIALPLDGTPGSEPEWVVWMFSPLEPLILHCTKHRTLATAIETAIAEYDDERGEDHDDGSDGSEVAQ